MDTVMQVVQLVVKFAVPLVAFSVGLSSGAAALKWLWKRPALLGRSLVAVLVLVPLAAVALVQWVELPRQVGVGLLVAAIAVGPVMALKKSKAQGGEHGYAVGLNLILLVASLVYVPAAVTVIGSAFGRDLQISIGEVARVILPLQLLPLIAGLAVARLAPKLAAKVSRPVTGVANVLLGVVAGVVLIAMVKPIVAIGAPGLLALLGFAVVAVLIGHLLGGPEEGTRTVLASFAAMRFPALAIALAGLTAAGLEVVPVVLAYLVITAIVLAFYAAAIGLSKRTKRREISGGEARPTGGARGAAS